MKLCNGIFSIALIVTAYQCILSDKEVLPPGYLLKQIDAFLKDELPLKNENSEHYSNCLKEYAQKAEQLYIDALIASHLCQMSIDGNLELLQNIATGSIDFSDQPLYTFDNLVALYQGKLDMTKLDTVKGGRRYDFSGLLADCLCNCPRYKPILNEKIFLLYKVQQDALLELKN